MINVQAAAAAYLKNSKAKKLFGELTDELHIQKMLERASIKFDRAFAESAERQLSAKAETKLT